MEPNNNDKTMTFRIRKLLTMKTMTFNSQHTRHGIHPQLKLHQEVLLVKKVRRWAGFFFFFFFFVGLLDIGWISITLTILLRFTFKVILSKTRNNLKCWGEYFLYYSAANAGYQMQLKILYTVSWRTKKKKKGTKQLKSEVPQNNIWKINLTPPCFGGRITWTLQLLGQISLTLTELATWFCQIHDTDAFLVNFCISHLFL